MLYGMVERNIKHRNTFSSQFYMYKEQRTLIIVVAARQEVKVCFTKIETTAGALCRFCELTWQQTQPMTSQVLLTVLYLTYQYKPSGLLRA